MKYPNSKGYYWFPRKFLHHIFSSLSVKNTKSNGEEVPLSFENLKEHGLEHLDLRWGLIFLLFIQKVWEYKILIYDLNTKIFEKSY